VHQPPRQEENAMSLTKRGNYWYGQAQADIRDDLLRYSKKSGYPIDYFADANCRCGGRLFTIDLDETQGVAGRICVVCGDQHLMADGEEYAEEAEFERRECVCGKDVFEVTAGVHVYRDPALALTEDVRWFYIGCRCADCGLVGCYADWKCEYVGYQSLLANV
jgi:hypothetical protein